MQRLTKAVVVVAAWGLIGSVAPAGAGVTNTWQEGGADLLWTTVGNWSGGHVPTDSELVRFPNLIGTAWTLRTNILNTVATVDGVLADTTDRSHSWLGTGTLNVSNDFRIKGWSMYNSLIQPTLNLGGRFIADYNTDGRGSFKFGDGAGYTSGNIFNGGVYNYGRLLYFGGATTFRGTLLAQSSRLLSFAPVGYGLTKIEGGGSVFGSNTVFDLRRGGTLWFSATNDFSNVGALDFNGGVLRLDAPANLFPAYTNGFEVKRGMLGIAGNGALGATDANGLRLGGPGSFGWLAGSAANSAGSYITRPVMLNGNGGVIWVSQYYTNADMNVATALTGPGMLIKTGEKALYLRNAGSGGASSYSGGTLVANGLLSVESARTLGAGNVAILGGGQLDLAAASAVAAGAKVLVGGTLYHPGLLRLLTDQAFPAIDTNSTGVIGLEVSNTHAPAAVGFAFLASLNNGARYSAASLPAGAGNTYRIGFPYAATLTGGGPWQSMLNLDVNGAVNGSGVLTGDNELLVAYAGCWLRDVNTFTGATTVRNNLQYNAWSCAWMQPVFMSAGSPLGSADGAVNLCNGGLYFDNQYSVNPGAIAKGALNIEGQNVIYIGTPAAVTSTVTFASINRNQRGQLSLGSTSAAWIGGLARLVATAAPTPVNGMVEPWLVYGWGAGSGTFLNYGGAGYTQAAYHVTVPAGAFPSLSGGTNVVQVTGAATLGDDPDIHALRADAAIGGAANTITLRSGGLILNSASTHTMKLKFGAAGDTEGIVYAAANAALSGTLTTTAGLTKGGPGELTLGADNTATLGGKIVINGGRLLVSADSALGQAANVVCLNGGGLQGSIAHTVSVGRVGGYLTGGPLSGPIVDETPGTPGGPLVVTVFNLVLSATNTFTCPLIVTGSIRVDGTGTPGKGPVTIKAGGAVTLFSSSGIDSAGRYSLQSGNNVASLILDASGTGGPARFYRLGSVEGSGNISFGSYLYPPANSALIVGNDNTSCDYGGSILQTPLASLNYAVVKEGTGTWTLWGDSVWQGPLIVSNGVLQVNGSIEGVSGATVCGGATLGGRGTIGAPLTVEAGGNLTGSLVFASNLTLGATASLDVTLAGTNAVSQYGQTQAAGVVNLNGAALVLRLGAAPVGGAVYTILDNRSALPVSGAFANAADGATLAASYGGRTCYFKVNYAGGDGNDVTLTAIPRSAGIYVW